MVPSVTHSHAVSIYLTITQLVEIYTKMFVFLVYTL